jgi:hypothetical protein
MLRPPVCHPEEEDDAIRSIKGTNYNKYCISALHYVSFILGRKMEVEHLRKLLQGKRKKGKKQKTWPANWNKRIRTVSISVYSIIMVPHGKKANTKQSHTHHKSHNFKNII